MTVRFPQNGKYTQPNKGDITGDLLRTTNIDLKTNPGLLRLSPRLTINTKDTDVASGFGIPIGFVVHTQNSTAQYWTACGIGAYNVNGTGKLFVSTNATGPNQSFTLDATASSPTSINLAASDIVEWQKNLYVSTFTGSTSNIAQLTSTWTTNWFSGSVSGSFVTSGSPKNMCPAFNGNLYVCDDYKVIYVPPSGNAVTSSTGTVNSQNVYRPIWIRSSSTRLWIGLMTMDSSTGAQGYIAEWDGSGTAFTRIYKLDAPCALSCVIKDDKPFVMDAFGRLLTYNNASFTEIARLPVANLSVEMPGIYDDLTNNRWIHHRGMDLVDGKINILVSNVDTNGNYIKEMPAGVWEYDQNIGLYHKNSPCYSATNYGQQALPSKGVGALYGTKKSTGTYLAGLTYYTDNATTQRYGIFYDDTATNTNKRGIIETVWTAAQQVEDSIQDLIYRFRLLVSGSHIIGKYRLSKDANLPFIAAITWTSTTVFTSSDSNMQYISAGNEVEVVMGDGASTTAHVSSISVNAGTYTVTLDEAIGPASGSGKAMFTNYKKAVDISATNIQAEKKVLGEVSNNFQIKTEFRGTGDFEIDDITIKTKVKQFI